MLPIFERLLGYALVAFCASRLIAIIANQALTSGEQAARRNLHPLALTKVSRAQWLNKLAVAVEVSAWVAILIVVLGPMIFPIFSPN